MININEKLKTRILSSLVMIPLVIGLLYLGGLAWLALVIICAAIAMWEWHHLCCHGRLSDRVLLLLGVIYISVAAWGVVLLREQGGGLLALAGLSLVALSDIGAYMGGKLIGGRKLVPQISPNKTYAGLFCGWGLSLAVAGFAYGMVWVGVIIAPLSQAGDIGVSALKRRAGVKDSGALIPGHGGILDRLDGYLAVGAIFVLWVLLGGGGL